MPATLEIIPIVATEKCFVNINSVPITNQGEFSSTGIVCGQQDFADLLESKSNPSPTSSPVQNEDGDPNAESSSNDATESPARVAGIAVGTVLAVFGAAAVGFIAKRRYARMESTPLAVSTRVENTLSVHGSEVAPAKSTSCTHESETPRH